MKKVLRVFLLAIMLLMLIPVSSVFAATDYSGGLLSGFQSFLLNDSDISTTEVTNSITDNNESTSTTLGKIHTKNYTAVTGFGKLSTAKVTSYRLLASSGVGLKFFDTNGQQIQGIASPKVDGSLNQINVDNVYSVQVYNPTSSSKIVYEVNVYGTTTSHNPKNLIASAGDSEVRLNWSSDFSSNYKIMRALQPSGPYSEIANNVSTTSFTDETVTNGVTYYYVVSAFRYFTPQLLFQESDYSNEVSATPQEAIADPPTDLSAIAGNAQVILSWTSSQAASSYNLYRSISSGGPYTKIETNVTGTTYTDNAVIDGTTYYYVITALTSGGESGNSNEASATLKEATRIILKINMTNGAEQEFDLSKTEFDSYVNWFDTRSTGSGPAKFTFDNQHLKGPFSSRKNSLVFEKILKYDFDEYAVDGSKGTAEVTPVTNGVALTLTLQNGTVVEFILSNTEYDAFSAWYDAKTNGTGLARYTFENPLAKGPFLNRSNVIIFDKISEIDVDKFGLTN